MSMKVDHDKLFTIVVCTYNGERHLRECLNALENLQDLRANVEKVYVVDNNSTDNSKRIIEEYCDRDPLFSYIFETRQGLSYAREQAAKATTEWVIYVDDDNILDSQWLHILKEIILNDNQVGVVNGAVIAMPEVEFDLEQKAILKAMYRNLACTHYSEPTENDPPNTIPMGAGMCVRTSALKRIKDEGWLTLKGRTGNNLSSGEDTELCEKVFSQGYRYICNYDMKLYHIIPSRRVDEKYVFRLIEGLVSGRLELVRKKKFGKAKCFLRKVKYKIILAREKLLLKESDNDIDEYWKHKVAIYQAEAFIRLI